MSVPRVMFIHGLEGHPNGTKVQMLRAQGFEVHAANMHMSVWQLGRRNSVIRNLLRASELRLALLGAVLGLAAAFATASVWPALAVLVGVVGWAGWRWRAPSLPQRSRSARRSA